MKTKIVISGYPKSGNTWVTRLVAELLHCPVAGFWGEPNNNEVAIEGTDRESTYECFKSHHQYHELMESPELDNYRLIYVIRDPRDIAISGSHYFSFPGRFKTIERVLQYVPGGTKLASINNQSYRLNKMIEAVLYGNSEVHHWTRVSWKNHLLPYLENEVFVVKYEDMLDNPQRECSRMLNYIGVERTDEEIIKIIEKQSFENAKKRFLEQGDLRRYHFLRKAKKEQWRSALSKRQKSKFDATIGDLLNQLGYAKTSK